MDDRTRAKPDYHALFGTYRSPQLDARHCGFYTTAMRFSGGTVANIFAWAVLIGLIAVAFVIVVIFGPFGLVLLGLFTLFICTAFQLNDDVPTWGAELFRARIARHGSPEQRAAMLEEKGAQMSPLRFYRWCGVALLVAGVAGFTWQQLH